MVWLCHDDETYLSLALCVLGVPDKAMEFSNFVQHVRAEREGMEEPTIVHCRCVLYVVVCVCLCACECAYVCASVCSAWVCVCACVCMCNHSITLIVT